MPEKSVREMGGWELFHYSLKTKVFRATLMGALVLGLVAMAVGLSSYTMSMIDRYIGESFGLAKSTAVIAERWISEDVIAHMVMDIYNGLTPEERSQTGTPEYRERFAHVMNERAFKYLKAILKDMLETGDVDDIYFGIFDRERQALVYICDPGESEKTGFWPGEWETVEKTEIERFYYWDGKGKLYDISNMPPYGWMCTSGVPLRDEEGGITGFILADVTLTNVAHGMRRFVLVYVLALLATIILVGWLMVRRMKRMLVQPINAIADTAKKYVEDRRRGITATDHFSRLSIRTGDEVENLSLVMAEMEHDLTDYEEYLTQVTAEKERIETELDLARRIQADMLPSVFPPFPDRSDVDIYASMTPAKEVGGDFYDFFLIDEDHLGLAIADISGKGIPAALFMMTCKTLVQNNATAGFGPSEVLSAVNRQICQNNREQMFVTMWFGILDLQTGRLVAANAGHEFPALKKPGQRFEIYKDKHCFVLGGMDDTVYKEYEMQLEPGTKLFVYTDGVPEATDKRDQAFGTERMLAALNEPSQDDKCQAVLERVQLAIARFVGSAPQFDDITMLCVEYKGPNGEGGGSCRR